LEDLGVYGRTILKYMFEKQNERASIGFIWLRIGTSEHAAETSGSIKDGEFLDWVRNDQFFKESAPCS